MLKSKLININTNNDLISIGFIVKVGSKNEMKKENGLSHFLEHMLFKGTKNYTTKKFLNKMDSLGLTYNAMTTHEYTFYEIHGHKNNWKQITDILFELYLFPKFNSKDVEIERGVILEEYNMTENNLDDYLYQNLFNNMYNDIHLQQSIIGEKKNLKKFNRNDLKNFHKKYYNLQNTKFIFIGNVNKKKVQNYINNKIKLLPIASKVSDKTKIKKNNQKQPRVEFKNIERTGQSQVLFGFNFSKENDIKTGLVKVLLSKGMSSKLVNLLRTKLGVSYSVNSDAMKINDDSIFFVKTGVDEKKLVNSLKGILNVLNKLITTEITSRELKKIKNIYINDLEALNLDNKELLHFYAEQSIYSSKIKSPKQMIKEVKKVSKKDIQKYCKSIFKADNLNLILMGYFTEPQKKKIIELLDIWYHKLNSL